MSAKVQLYPKSGFDTRAGIDRVAIWWVVGLGAALRLITLSRQSLWLDEGVSFWTVNRPFSELLEMLSGGFRPLYFIFLHPAVALGGDEWLLRLPSALAGIASIGLIYALGKQLFDERTGLLAAVLLAVSPLHIWYSQEARMYALVSFLVVTAAYFATRAFRTNHLIDWVLAGIFEGLALWTESAAVWFVLAINLTGLILIVYLVRSHRLWQWAVFQAVAFLVYLPAIPSFFEAVQGTHTLWIPPATVTGLLRILSDFAGGFQRTRWEGIIALILLVVGMLLGAREMIKDARSSHFAYALLAIWFFVVVGTSFAISQVYFRPSFFTILFGQRQSVFLTRNLITALVPLLLLLARSLRLSPFRRLGKGILVGFILLNLIAYFGNSLSIRKEDYRAAAEIVAQYSQPGDRIVTSPGYIEQPFAYYYLEPEPAGLPLEMVRDGVVGDDTQVYASTTQALAGSSRVWLVTNQNVFQDADEDLIEQLDNEMQLSQAWEVEGVTIRLYEPRPITGRR